MIPQQHLLTEFAFLDTEAYIRCRFDFANGHLGKLAEYGRAGLVRVLITDVTRREVLKHLETHTRIALETARKDHHILTQAGMQLGSPISAEGRVITARIEEIDTINVIDARPPFYTCALEFEAALTLDLEITDVSALDRHEFFRSTLEVAERCTAEVQLRYSGTLFDIESVTVDEETINLDEMIEDFYS